MRLTGTEVADGHRHPTQRPHSLPPVDEAGSGTSAHCRPLGTHHRADDGVLDGIVAADDLVDRGGADDRDPERHRRTDHVEARGVVVGMGVRDRSVQPTEKRAALDRPSANRGCIAQGQLGVEGHDEPFGSADEDTS